MKDVIQEKKAPVGTASTGPIYRIVLDVLNDFEIRHIRADILLRRHLHKHQKSLGGPERAKISRTVSNILRWRSRFDYIISRLLKIHAERIEPSVRNMYRIAVFNVVFLKRPVELACSISDYILAGYADLKPTMRAFIKTLHTTYESLPFPNPEKNRINAWSVIHSHPEWMVEKLIARYGEAATERILGFNNLDSNLQIRVNSLKASAGEVESALRDLGLNVVRLNHARLGYAVNGPVAAFGTPVFLAGSFEVQDESSQVFVEWCDPSAHSHVLDACSGGGGKALYMAALMNNTGRIAAYDTNASALAELKKRAARAGAFNIEIHKTIESLVPQSFDLVLVDAPCSGIGTLRRNPDIKWNLLPSDVVNLSTEQAQILDRYSIFVRKGGVLIYATCTLLPEENEDIVRRFLTTHTEFTMIHDASSLFAGDDGFFRILPHEHSMSGFFGCKLKRT